MNTTTGNELLKNGMAMVKKGAFGAAAFYFFGAVKTNPKQLDAWMNLFVSLQQLDRQADLQILLARYAQLGLPFAPPFANAAAAIYRNNPIAMRDWLETTKSNGMTGDDSEGIYTKLKTNVDLAYQQVTEHFSGEQLEERGILPLLRIAAWKTPLELWADQPGDGVIDRIEEAINTMEYAQALEAIQALAIFPLPKSETILRKFCRDEAKSSKLKTHALITLRRAGISGNIKVHKLDKEWTVDLDNPEVAIEDKLPAAFEPIMNWVTAWLGKENGVLDEFSFAKLTGEPAKINAPAIMEKIGDKPLPKIVLMSAGFILKEAYLHYYPDIPYAGYQIDEWGSALLSLTKAYSQHADIEWEYAKTFDLSGTALRRKEWLVNAIPELKEVVDGQKDGGESGDSAQE